MADSLAFNMDCMEAMKRFPDKFFDLAVVDPPYGGVTQGGYMSNKMSGGVSKNRNDYHLSLWKCAAPDNDYFEELKRTSKNQIIWGGNYYSSKLQDSQCWLVWDKEKPEGISFADVELAWTSFNQAARIFHFAWNGMIQGNMKNKEHKIHPTQKPVALYGWIYKEFAKPGFKILDTHLGSGSSRIAAYDAGLDFWGYEIDKTYFDLQEERFQRHIAQQNLFLMEGDT